MDDANSLGKLVPGFDFLQGLVKNAGAALPGIGQWIAPTMDPAELEKRIGELKTVQFWLEQNARMLATTIQALEVQKMTLSTLRTMNVQMGDLRDSLTLKAPAGGSSSAAAAKAPAKKAAGAAVPGVVDPMQWWGALTSQFAQLAASAVKDSATDAAKTMAGKVLQQGMDTAAATFKAAAGAPGRMVSAAGAAARGAAGAAAGRAAEAGARGTAEESAAPPKRKKPARKRAAPAKDAARD